MNAHKIPASPTPPQLSQTRARPTPGTVYWFRPSDLRLDDNPPLLAACDSASSGVLPLFIFDPSYTGATSPLSGRRRLGIRRAAFLLECVEDLRRRIVAEGGELVVVHGPPEEVLSELAGDGTEVYCQAEVASEERRALRRARTALEGRGARLVETWGGTMYDLPFGTDVERGGGAGAERMGAFEWARAVAAEIPDTFTPFRNKVEERCSIPSPRGPPAAGAFQNVNQLDGDSAMPSLADLGFSLEEIAEMQRTDEEISTWPLSERPMEFRGGETAALARVSEYIWEKDLLKIYFDTRNGMLGADYSTKFSPWLSHGCLSARRVAAECARYELERGIANKSTYWVVFELLLRDFFRLFAAKHGDDIFKLNGTLGDRARESHPNSRPWRFDRKIFEAWTAGRTGYPLVDANMRELVATGFMSNRGRQNVCSFLAIDTSTDWRYGAWYFEEMLLDHDVHSNWGSWCSGAGMTGGRLNRFNIVKQSKDYDRNGDYIRRWVPELGRVPSPLIFTPWKMTKEEQKKYGVSVGADYPTPIVIPTGVERKSDDGNKTVDEKGLSGCKEGSKGGRSSGSYHSKHQRQ
eukprot:CAMPEP_0194284364 /NCGR_PEP_ID=MMETSP0169-20130528/27458_1 /TAXON_ID=218684 /ORGANISM="Corethron pennatum, Strain L29A3" /LENGTH=578 /DNA_ID=CAMNT_0039030165 /DNA_START=133 /DNA_END=1866 /DNA_ORIENTATION=+